MKIQYMSDLHMELAENSRYIKHNEFSVTGNSLCLMYLLFSANSICRSLMYCILIAFVH